jgi:hypothetical protein
MDDHGRGSVKNLVPEKKVCCTPSKKEKREYTGLLQQVFIFFMVTKKRI